MSVTADGYIVIDHLPAASRVRGAAPGVDGRCYGGSYSSPCDKQGDWETKAGLCGKHYAEIFGDNENA